MASLPPLERGLRLLELATSSSDGITYKQAHEYLGVATSTIARLLKVLVQEEYLIQDNGHYKPGIALQRLSFKNNVHWLLTHHAAILAEELADFMKESCVVTLYSNGHFEFTGVKTVKDSISYGEQGHKIYHSRGHVLTMISHAMMTPQEAKKYFNQEDPFLAQESPSVDWKDYVKSIVYGMGNGKFLELGWRRPHLFRVSVPVFSEDGKLAGAFFCGFYNHETLMNSLDTFMDAGFKALSRIHAYKDIFERGMKGLRKNLELWQNELKK